VPFANTSGGIAIPFQIRSYGQSGIRNQGRRESTQYTKLSNSMRITTGKKSITGRSATGSGGMSIGKAHSFLGEAINIGCFEKTARTVRSWLPVTHVIEKNKKDVGLSPTFACKSKNRYNRK
jgi:hypothetical protein